MVPSREKMARKQTLREAHKAHCNADWKLHCCYFCGQILRLVNDVAWQFLKQQNVGDTQGFI